MLKFLFIVIAAIFSLMLMIYKLILCKLKRTSKTSLYISVMTFLLFLYITFALLLVILVPKVLSKFIIGFFAISPFIIGRLATYKKENLYSWLQIFMVILSIFCVLLII